MTPGETHIWWTVVDVDSSEADALIGILDSAEQARAQRFAFPHLRNRFVAGHAFMRRVLSKYADMAAEEIAYRYGARGKPALAGGGNLHFNLSHSGGLAALAVTRGGEVGIDIERIHQMQRIAQLARRFFSAAENEWLFALPESGQLRGFFECWTAKEAYIKARGDGLAYPLESFGVLRGDSGELRLTVEREPAENERWRMTRFWLEEDVPGAVAVESEGAPKIFRF